MVSRKGVVRRTRWPVRFEIRADPCCFFVAVEVHRSEAEMYRAIRRAGQTPANCAAMTWTYEVVKFGKGGVEEVVGEVGRMFLRRDNLSAKLLAHETAHAALYVSKRHGVFPKVELAPNEPFCYAMGQLHDSLLAGLRERGVIS